MDRNPFVRTGLVFIIVILFVLVSMLPAVCSLSMEKGARNIQLKKKGVRDDNDTTPPATTISFDPPIPNGCNGWYVSNVTVTLNATDNESGVWRTYCSLLPPGQVYTEPIVLSNDDIYYIYFWSVDYAGNVELPKSVGIKIDKTPPVLILNYTWVRIGFKKYNIIVTVTCYDAMTGIAKIEFYFNGELQETVTGPGPPEYVWTYNYIPLPNVTIKVIVFDSACNVAEAEIINPHSTSAQSQSQLIQNFLLRHHTIKEIPPGLSKVNQ
jgi:hypothetical protein